MQGDPAQRFEADGFLNGNGADVQQLSFSSGRSTICAYEIVTEALVAARVIRTRRGRDRLRLTAGTRDSDSNVYVTAAATSAATATLPSPTPQTSTSGPSP